MKYICIETMGGINEILDIEIENLNSEIKKWIERLKKYGMIKSG